MPVLFAVKGLEVNFNKEKAPALVGTSPRTVKLRECFSVQLYCALCVCSLTGALTPTDWRLVLPRRGSDTGD